MLLTYRVERVRSLHRDPTGGERQGLRMRCLQLLDELQASLDGSEAWHVEVLREVAAARAEVALED